MMFSSHGPRFVVSELVLLDLKLTLPNHRIKLRRHLARGLIPLFRALNIRFGRTHHAEFDVV